MNITLRLSRKMCRLIEAAAHAKKLPIGTWIRYCAIIPALEKSRASRQKS